MKGKEEEEGKEEGKVEEEAEMAVSVGSSPVQKNLDMLDILPSM